MYIYLITYMHVYIYSLHRNINMYDINICCIIKVINN